MIVIYFLIGIVIGKFINSCIDALPQKRAFKFQCPFCGNPSRFKDSIPVISYLLLRGRSACCKSKLPVRLPLVELAGGVILAGHFWLYGLSLSWAYYSVFAFLVLTISIIDLEQQLILNSLTLPGIAIGFLGSPFLISLKSSFVGILVGGGVLYLMALLGQFTFHKESMGGGDIKLGAMAGAFLGPTLMGIALIIAFFLGGVTGSLLILGKKAKKTSRIPFGPFISLGSLSALYFGEKIQSLWN